MPIIKAIAVAFVEAAQGAEPPNGELNEPREDGREMGLAAWGAMTLVSREWAAEVGLLVYFPVLVLMADGIDRERVKRFFEGWRRWRA